MAAWLDGLQVNKDLLSGNTWQASPHRVLATAPWTMVTVSSQMARDVLPSER